jgi:hypothetical protein
LERGKCWWANHLMIIGIIKRWRRDAGVAPNLTLLIKIGTRLHIFSTTFTSHVWHPLANLRQIYPITSIYPSIQTCPAPWSQYDNIFF